MVSIEVEVFRAIRWQRLIRVSGFWKHIGLEVAQHTLWANGQLWAARSLPAATRTGAAREHGRTLI